MESKQTKNTMQNISQENFFSTVHASSGDYPIIVRNALFFIFLLIFPALCAAEEIPAGSPRAIVRDITPEYGPSGAGTGFTFNREDKMWFDHAKEPTP